jgi:hypothetical protein
MAVPQFSAEVEAVLAEALNLISTAVLVVDGVDIPQAAAERLEMLAGLKLAVQGIRILTAVEMAAVVGLELVVLEKMAGLVESLVVQAAVVVPPRVREVVMVEQAHAEKSGCGFTNERHNKKESSWR